MMRISPCQNGLTCEVKKKFNREFEFFGEIRLIRASKIKGALCKKTWVQIHQDELSKMKTSHKPAPARCSR